MYCEGTVDINFLRSMAVELIPMSFIYTHITSAADDSLRPRDGTQCSQCTHTFSMCCFNAGPPCVMVAQY